MDSNRTGGKRCIHRNYCVTLHAVTRRGEDEKRRLERREEKRREEKREEERGVREERGGARALHSPDRKLFLLKTVITRRPRAFTH